MTFSCEDANRLRDEICAEWVKALDFKMTEITADGGRFHWQAPQSLCRVIDEETKIVSGQAVMSVADTASFMAICAINQGFANCVTVDLSANFLRPLFEGEITVEVKALVTGRKLVTTRSEFYQKGNAKLAATASGVFAYV